MTPRCLEPLHTRLTGIGHYEVGKDALSSTYLRVLEAYFKYGEHGLRAQPASMTAVTPVASRKTRPTVDFNNSPLSDRTRHLFPGGQSQALAETGQDDTTGTKSLKPSPTVLLHSNSSGEGSSRSSSILSIHNEDSDQDINTLIYRSAKDLPHELETHCNIYLEERLYDKAIILLNNLLVSGTSYSQKTKAWLPPKNQVAFITTLLVHPNFTTRATANERAEIPSQALILLRNILSILGPSRANLREAFAFHPKASLRPNRRTGRAVMQDVQKRATYGEDPINSKFAGESSLWLRAQDFWQVVGWAFNCSVHHRQRWNTWRIWLDYMLDVMEADWNDEPTAIEDDVGKKQGGLRTMERRYQNRIIIQYTTECASSSTALRRIVKSIFANGSAEALKAYPEIFKDETREPNSERGTKRKREVKLNLDEDEYGDYFRDEEDYDDTPAPSQSEVTDDRSDISDYINIVVDPEATTIRLRLLALLSLVSFTVPSLFVPIRELYKIYVESIKPLPLPIFALFVSPSAMPHLPLVALSSVVQAHLAQLLPWSAPQPTDDEVTQEKLERCFLPFAANTSSIEDNAKVSLLVETLVRLLATHGGVDCTPEFVATVDKGIKAREKKCTAARKKKSDGSKDDEDIRWLNSSAERMRMLVKYFSKSTYGR